MQGTLTEIDIRSILQLIELGQRTGELFVEAYHNHPTNSNRRMSLKYSDSLGNVAMDTYSYTEKKSLTMPFWFVFFLNGKIAYAANNDRSLSRLRDHLWRYKAKAALDKLEIPGVSASNTHEYAYLWALLENHTLTPAQGRSILESMVHETLFDLLSLHQGAFIFEISPALTPQLTTLEIAPLVLKIMKQVQEWKQFHPHIQSPKQCPLIVNASQLKISLPQNTFHTLERWADGKTSLRQLARYLNRDILTVARALYPYIQHGWIQLHSPMLDITTNQSELVGKSSAAKVIHIVCIDDDMTVGKTVEYILEKQGYKVSIINNPLEALSLIFPLKPDLIFCDIAMPELDGYEICAMLRQSKAFRVTPIIMLTGMDGFIDRVRARMVGATDYLTKPFGENELLMLLERYIIS